MHSGYHVCRDSRDRAGTAVPSQRYTLPRVLHSASNSSSPLHLTTPCICNYSGSLTTFGGSQGILVLRARQPQAALPAAQKDASRRRRRGIKHLNSYCSTAPHNTSFTPLVELAFFQVLRNDIP